MATKHSHCRNTMPLLENVPRYLKWLWLQIIEESRLLYLVGGLRSAIALLVLYKSLIILGPQEYHVPFQS